MSNTGKEDAQSEGTCCPLCAAWEEFRNSKTAHHLRAMEREGLLALRAALDAAIERCEQAYSNATEAPETPVREDDEA